MNSVNFICDNYEPRRDTVKEDLLLYGDSRSDENKNKVISFIYSFKSLFTVGINDSQS